MSEYTPISRGNMSEINKKIFLKQKKFIGTKK